MYFVQWKPRMLILHTPAARIPRSTPRGFNGCIVVMFELQWFHCNILGLRLKSHPGGGTIGRVLMGMCRWMGSHFHHWIDHNRVVFSIALLERAKQRKDRYLWLTYRRCLGKRYLKTARQLLCYLLNSTEIRKTLPKKYFNIWRPIQPEALLFQS